MRVPTRAGLERGLAVLVVLLVVVVVFALATFAVAPVLVEHQQCENYVVQPRVLEKAVDVPGALVVIAAPVGGTLPGMIGPLLAVPVAAAQRLVRTCSGRNPTPTRRVRRGRSSGTTRASTAPAQVGASRRPAAPRATAR